MYRKFLCITGSIPKPLLKSFFAISHTKENFSSRTNQTYWFLSQFDSTIDAEKQEGSGSDKARTERSRINDSEILIC
jgi:hypothetical protein